MRLYDECERVGTCQLVGLFSIIPCTGFVSYPTGGGRAGSTRAIFFRKRYVNIKYTKDGNLTVLYNCQVQFDPIDLFRFTHSIANITSFPQKFIIIVQWCIHGLIVRLTGGMSAMWIQGRIGAGHNPNYME